MLEVGWSEIFVIALILIIVVGPKDLPGMLRTFGRMATRLRGMANEFKGQFDEAIREADLDDVRKGLNEVRGLNPTNSLRDAINPIRKLGEDIKSDLRKASDISDKPVATTDTTAVSESTDALVASPVPTPLVETSTPAIQPIPAVQPAPTSVQITPAAASVPAAVVSSPPVVAEPVSAKLKATRKKVAKDVTSVAAEPVAAPKKPSSRKKSTALAAPVETALVVTETKKKTAPRKKAAKAGDA